jgi:hypothetical protein
MVIVWVGGIATAAFYPNSFLGAIVHAPLGLPAYILGVAGLFGIVGVWFSARGKPFLKKANDVA